MSRRRAKIVIVEGLSDSKSLSVYLSRYFDSKNIEFIELHSNILSNTYMNTDTNNILTHINSIVDSYLENNRHIKISYIDEIIQIIDTDGMFIPENKILLDSNIEKIAYSLDNIYTNDVESIIKLNKNKCNNLKNILSKNIITIKRIKIPYKVFFMSRNLEHVLHNRIDNVSNEDKENLSYIFANKFINNNDFVSFMKNSEFSLIAGYKESWDFIKKDENSLKRYSNLGLIFLE